MRIYIIILYIYIIYIIYIFFLDIIIPISSREYAQAYE